MKSPPQRGLSGRGSLNRLLKEWVRGVNRGGAPKQPHTRENNKTYHPYQQARDQDSRVSSVSFLRLFEGSEAGEGEGAAPEASGRRQSPQRRGGEAATEEGRRSPCCPLGKDSEELAWTRGGPGRKSVVPDPPGQQSSRDPVYRPASAALSTARTFPGGVSPHPGMVPYAGQQAPSACLRARRVPSDSSSSSPRISAATS